MNNCKYKLTLKFSPFYSICRITGIRCFAAEIKYCHLPHSLNLINGNSSAYVFTKKNFGVPGNMQRVFPNG